MSITTTMLLDYALQTGEQQSIRDEVMYAEIPQTTETEFNAAVKGYRDELTKRGKSHGHAANMATWWRKIYTACAVGFKPDTRKPFSVNVGEAEEILDEKGLTARGKVKKAPLPFMSRVEEEALHEAVATLKARNPAASVRDILKSDVIDDAVGKEKNAILSEAAREMAVDVIGKRGKEFAAALADAIVALL